jgi:hypothetical protein
MCCPAPTLEPNWVVTPRPFLNMLAPWDLATCPCFSRGSAPRDFFSHSMPTQLSETIALPSLGSGTSELLSLWVRPPPRTVPQGFSHPWGKVNSGAWTDPPPPALFLRPCYKSGSPNLGLYQMAKSHGSALKIWFAVMSFRQDVGAICCPMNYTVCNTVHTPTEITLNNMWHKEHPWNFSVLQTLHLTNLVW